MLGLLQDQKCSVSRLASILNIARGLEQAGPLVILRGPAIQFSKENTGGLCMLTLVHRSSHTLISLQPLQLMLL